MSIRLMEPGECTFTVVLRGKHFELSDSSFFQIRFDSPNKFTGVFLGGNGGTDIMYSDRRPEYFPIISEWLAGYQDMFPIRLEGMSDIQAMKAILAEAEHFKLKKLAEKLKTALKLAEPLKQPLLWPYRGYEDGTHFRLQSGVRDIDDVLKKYPDGKLRQYFTGGTFPVECIWFHHLQLRFDCRNLSAEGLPAVSVLFLEDEVQAAIDTFRGIERQPLPVDFWDSTAQQASARIDKRPISLAVLMKWIASPSKVVVSKDSPLEPLATYFQPEAIPQAHRILTIRVHRVIGYIRGGHMRLAHLDIFSNHQGYMLWSNVGYDHTSTS
ncbi:hypothetical protein RTBOTA2_004751 [Rhodotorula toruloides]|uniref:FGENESH: predicted gene_3.226 protein n=1 Tax=Rhodotorula toruloides TaxID=5286 RepID=A0A0K3C872_RHOTO|nr:hypothetical protein RTBOTA2_004751 [Rhodotorula toruloides]